MRNNRKELVALDTATELRVARKIKAARALVLSARNDLLSAGRREPRKGGPVEQDPTMIRAGQALQALEAIAVEHTNPIWRWADIGLLLWGRDHRGHKVALDVVEPNEVGTPLIEACQDEGRDQPTRDESLSGQGRATTTEDQ